MSIGIAIVGFGHIARAEHLPAIAADPAYRLVAVAAPHGAPDAGVPVFADLEALLDALGDAVDAVAICTPPAARFALARLALSRGKAVLLEKPPAATLAEAQALADLALRHGSVLFAAWHSQFAPAVAPVQAMLADDPGATLSIRWHENVRQWHAGQDWIWQADGFGVFDAAINGLSIATRLLAEPLMLAAATLAYPANRAAPIAARLAFASIAGGADFDWRVEERQTWSIRIETRAGRVIAMTEGGHRLDVDDRAVPLPARGEYPALYSHFAALVCEGRSDVDLAPMRVVADALRIGERVTVEPFA